MIATILITVILGSIAIQELLRLINQIFKPLAWQKYRWIAGPFSRTELALYQLYSLALLTIVIIIQIDEI